MNEETLNDLKQFITTTVQHEINGVHQEIAGVKQEMTDMHQEIAGLHQEVAGLHQEVDARFDENETTQNEILNAIGEIHELQSKAICRQADVIDDHEHRIARLEKRTA